jgi:hypothetical protein
VQYLAGCLSLYDHGSDHLHQCAACGASHSVIRRAEACLFQKHVGLRTTERETPFCDAFRAKIHMRLASILCLHYFTDSYFNKSANFFTSSGSPMNSIRAFIL